MKQGFEPRTSEAIYPATWPLRFTFFAFKTEHISMYSNLLCTFVTLNIPVIFSIISSIWKGACCFTFIFQSLAPLNQGGVHSKKEGGCEACEKSKSWDKDDFQNKGGKSMANSFIIELESTLWTASPWNSAKLHHLTVKNAVFQAPEFPFILWIITQRQRY